MRQNITTPANHDTPTPAPAEVLHEYVPLDERQIHGVTFDGKSVWFARDDEVVAFDPNSGQVARRLPIPGADAGTAFDGQHLYQLAKGEILVIRPDDGQIVRRLPAPGKGEDSGMAWADGYLWIGQCYGARIHKVDAATGEVVKTLTSDRFVTGVTVVDGQLWHGAAGDDKPSELRRLAADGTPEEVLAVPAAMIAGVEADGHGRFWCAGEQGKLRLVRRKPVDKSPAA
ncbi:glutamine cyclotransferase [Nannocystis punicea]|uniref:Glutamine cyclotransferase n=1 Tax=Nannocystis punicea TaxID=2995304 RepID=A0ABY7GVX7_9BACT|nr:glutamine cyclotransferase [Nannocystis poenicansa]WAS91125.1 glutamine cyclotransferase [Nannocystis poenicansa]